MRSDMTISAVGHCTRWLWWWLLWGEEPTKIVPGGVTMNVCLAVGKRLQPAGVV